MSQRSRRVFRWTVSASLVTAVLFLTPLSTSEASGGEKEEKASDAKKDSTTKKPRVITNADLAKYGKRATVVSGKVVTKPNASLMLPEPPPSQPAQPRTSLPPEDRLDGASLPELEERQRELQELLKYLKAKAAWIKNPFLPQPSPLPVGEVLLDEKLSGGEELRLTRTRVFAVEGRLGKIRLLIQSGGGQAPAQQP